MIAMHAIWNTHRLTIYALGAIAIGWSIAAITVFVSMVDTGNSLIESAPAPGLPEEPSPYFRIAAIAALAPVLIIAPLILTTGWLGAHWSSLRRSG